MASQMFVACRKCGEPMPVDHQMIANAIALGQELVVEHESCGEETRAAADGPPRRFRVQIIAFELPADAQADLARIVAPRDAVLTDGKVCEVLGWVGETVHARNFPEAVNGPMTTWLAGAWERFQQNAAYADLPPSAPQT